MKTPKEILSEEIRAEIPKMLLEDEVITRHHNGITYSMINESIVYRAMEAYAQEFADQQQIPKDVAEKILKVRDAFIERDPSEAWHWLYNIASPNYDKKEPWEELEMIAGRTPLPPLPEKPTT